MLSKRPRRIKKGKTSKYYIDQSGKVEQTNKPTVVALANEQVKTVRISAVEKRKLINSLREIRKPNKTYVYDIFAALIYLLLSHHPITDVQIDKEYPGHEAKIKERLIQFFERNKRQAPLISFGLIGKKSEAHISGLLVFQGKSKASEIVKAEDILKVVFDTKKGWRPRSGRGNP